MTGDSKLLIRKSLSRARDEAVIDQALPFPASKVFSVALPDNANKIGMTFDVLPMHQYSYFIKLLPEQQLLDISALNSDLRSVKSDWEVDEMHRGAEQLCSVFAQVPDFLEEGMREVDLSAEFEMRLRKVGGERYLRMRAYNQ